MSNVAVYRKPAPQRIAIIEPRLPEIGRLRLGDQKTDPRKPGTPLSTFRVTSPDRRVIDAVVAAYGGKVTKWEKQWQATITARQIPVVIPPFANYSSCYELWAGGGCQRRCDGITAHVIEQGPEPYMVERPCVCNPEKRECKPTSRLNVMLRGVDTLGTFRLETHSVFAAIELPGQVDLAAAAAEQGGLIPATLSIEDREMKKATEKYPRRFKVPVLRLNVSIEQLAGSSLPELPPVAPMAALPAPAEPHAPVQADQQPPLVATAALLKAENHA